MYYMALMQIGGVGVGVDIVYVVEVMSPGDITESC